MANFRSSCFVNSENVAGGWANSFIKSKEGTAVGFLLVWCGRSATTLVATRHTLKITYSK